MLKLHLAAIIASFFSIIFSVSIIIELKPFVDPLNFILIAVFLVFILVMNEYFKVVNLKRKFNRIKTNLTVITITFSLSLILSSIGIFFWTHKSDSTAAKNNEVVAKEKLQITTHYAHLIDSIANAPIQSQTYENTAENIVFWRNRICRNDTERQQARQNIISLENTLKELESTHNTKIAESKARFKELEAVELSALDSRKQTADNSRNKNLLLFFIFMCLVILTEVMIVYIQYHLTTEFSLIQKKYLSILHNVLCREGDHITLDDLRYHHLLNPSRSNDQDVRQEALSFYFLLGNLGIISKEKRDNGQILNKEEAFKMLKKYYTRSNQII